MNAHTFRKFKRQVDQTVDFFIDNVVDGIAQVNVGHSVLLNATNLDRNILTTRSSFQTGEKSLSQTDHVPNKKARIYSKLVRIHSHRQTDGQM